MAELATVMSLLFEIFHANMKKWPKPEKDGRNRKIE
jgi:hypothetical protein